MSFDIAQTLQVGRKHNRIIINNNSEVLLGAIIHRPDAPPRMVNLHLSTVTLLSGYTALIALQCSLTYKIDLYNTSSYDIHIYIYIHLQTLAFRHIYIYILLLLFGKNHYFRSLKKIIILSWSEEEKTVTDNRGSFLTAYLFNITCIKFNIVYNNYQTSKAEVRSENNSRRSYRTFTFETPVTTLHFLQIYRLKII